MSSCGCGPSTARNAGSDDGDEPSRLHGSAVGSVERTNLCTLYLRAYEGRLPSAILGDTAAADAVDRIDYDWERMRRTLRPATAHDLVTTRCAGSTCSTASRSNGRLCGSGRLRRIVFPSSAFPRI